MTDTTWKSNEMCLIYFLFLSTVKAVEMETRIWDNKYNDNGWTPISSDNVYNSFDEKLFPKFNGKGTLDQTTNELIHSHGVFPDPEFQSKFIQPRYMEFDKLISSGISPNFLIDSKGNEDGINMVKSNSINYRKPKAISGNGIDVVNMITEPEQLIVQKDTNNATEQVILKHENKYQVTENQEQKEDFEKISSDISKPLNNEPSSNHYDVVKGTVPYETYSNSNEFTKKFHDILSSYNIRVNDVLPNYDLSRHYSRKPSLTREYIMVPIPIRLANRFNSMNNLPFDPLLAVFLSNFGYYLPGHYGVNNKYYNLYGYLASNNIHNNEPFGSYKIFTDTDSSS